MPTFHPYLSEVEGPFSRFSAEQVDLGADLTAAGRQLALGVIAVVEVEVERSANCPLLYRDKSFIAGSLGRRTQEQPLDDVDVYLVLEAPEVTGAEDGLPYPLTSHASRPNTPLTDDPTLRSGNNFSADAVVNRFASYLDIWFPKNPTGKGRAGKTCYVRLGTVNIDLSPVIWFKSTVGGIDEYWMPAGRGTPYWKRTNPKEDQRFLTDANQAHNGGLLRIVRMIKWWNANYNSDRLKGIHLETMVVKAFRGIPVVGWAYPLTWLFDMLYEALDSPCPDPTGLGDPLDSSLSSLDRSASREALFASKAIASAAADAAIQGKPDECLHWWRSIFPGLGQ